MSGLKQTWILRCQCARRMAVAVIMLAMLCAIANGGKREEIAGKIRNLTQPATLNFWQTHNSEETQTLKDIVTAFQKEYPNVKVVMDTVAFAEAQTKFKTAAKAGKTPDCFRSEVAWTPDFAELGYLTPLDEYLTQADKDSYLAGPMRTAVYKEETWGLPQVTDCLALLYNKRLFNEAGAEPPKTFDELVAAGRKLSKPEANKYAFAYPANDSYFILPYIWSFGGGLIDEQSRKILINDEGSVKGLQFALELRSKEKIVSPTFDVANDYTNQLEDFKAGRLAMFFMGPWATANILSGDEFKSAPANLGVTDLPKGPADSGSPIGGHAYVVSAASKNPDIAFFFLDWINQPKNQAMFTVKNNLLPTHKAAYDLPEVKSNDLVQAFRRQLDTARTRPIIPEAASIFPPFTKSYQDALRGAKPPKDALDDVAREWKRLLEK
ncbi:MAG: extracellular solute-binding protein [Candidatus Sumerlaeota bacterium]|nr:extracellular solute-binding protein [Candidatus Sumerlaeota bacterium]